MKMGIKTTLAALALTLAGSSAFAYISAGNWHDGNGVYYYVNGHGAYCSTPAMAGARQLSPRQIRELATQRYDGACNGYDKGAKSYRGVTYYFNGAGHYCEYRDFKPGAEVMSPRQANDLFNNNDFDGTCVE